MAADQPRRHPPDPANPAGTADARGRADTADTHSPARRHTPGAWWRRRGLRARLTLAASAGLAVALAVASLSLLTALQRSLTNQVDGNARQAADEVAALVNAHTLPNPVPFGQGTLSVQVIDSGGFVVQASAQSDRLVPLLRPAMAYSLARTGRAIEVAGQPFGIAAPLRVVAVPADNDEVVIAAASDAQVSESVRAATQAVLIGVPVLFLLLATATWLVTGAALRPIEELRRGAQEITGAAIAQGRTLPVPEARDEVHSLAVTLNDMLARLDAAQQRQRAFVSDAAHELRSPIASIRTQLEVAVDHPEVMDWRQTAAGVLSDTLRLARLAEDLLALARLDERADRPQPGRPVDLAGLAEGVCARYGDAAMPVTARAFGRCLVCGDPGGLDRMLVNLIDNAVRYAHSRVSVVTRADGPWLVLSVTDDGPGIPDADCERVFDRFTRLDDARSHREDGPVGAGLGLAIVRATAVAHGGTAWLEDAVPGLRALVRLPAARLPAARLPATPGQQGGDGDRGEQQGQVGDRQVEQPHRGEA
jgi:signal transduction histidine kinase